MNPRVKKILLLLLAAALVFGAGQTQHALNRDRDRLGLTHAATLENAPPVLVFTTVALGGFRGLISNYLWMRADELQQEDKYFEAAQLASWITDLEPRLPVVWVFQAWNMAYNISVKFKENAPGDYSDRWRWINNGIELLRDKGLLYNPNDPLIYFQLGQFFGHKMGQISDDANLYYKREWAMEMTPFFGPNGTNFDGLIRPQTAEERTNALALRDKYKIDPAFAQKVNGEYGPLDWRLPEAHAIYWYAMGLERATTNNSAMAKPEDIDLMQLRRGIYQTEQQAFRHGHMIVNPFTHAVELAPDLDLIPKANDSYLQMFAGEPDGSQKANILQAHRNFLRSAVKYLYQNDRMADAARWYKYLADKYPDQPIIEGQPNSLPKNVTLDDYVITVMEADISLTSPQDVTSGLQGMLVHAYLDLANGQDARSTGYLLLAQKVYDNYKTKTENNERTRIATMDDLKREVLSQLLDPQNGLPFDARARIRTQLRMPAETIAPTNSTNAVAPSTPPSPTNAPAANSAGR
jgi:hypothetical protein